MNMLSTIKWLAMLSFITACSNTKQDTSLPNVAAEKYRPLIHFTPAANWMNDPNGMVYYNNQYHLFYQYYPGSTKWGPMHWGHATSEDLFHWKHLPVALYPDSLGYIFSGSAVVDTYNTSGFGTNNHPPLVAIYTSHDPVGESEKGNNTFQRQCIAYSNDSGKTWIKYSGNPVIKNPGIRDFRDPKVHWYEPGKKWIMTLATQNCVTFYSSEDLKNWKRESEFGKTMGAHGGVWECPDLFKLDYNGKTMYVLLASINPGAPNGGSATQYFIGDFDGNTFVPADTNTRWLDYGPDDYAGVTWSNTGTRRIFLGWMSNWAYADTVPTEKWRSANTIPRELRIEKNEHGYLLASTPVDEIKKIESPTTIIESSSSTLDLSSKVNFKTPCIIKLDRNNAEDFSFELSNAAGENIMIGYDKTANHYYIDRSKSGNTGFSQSFASKSIAPKLSDSQHEQATIIIDQSSVELFADNGLSVLTSLYFAGSPYTNAVFKINSGTGVTSISYTPLKSIYSNK